MSIVTLKRKTNTKYNNMSVGVSNFSLNGTLRNQGYIGQTTLSRSLPKTLMKGNTIRGHGGRYGAFKICPIVQSAVKSLNDPSVIKPSVITTDGMIDTKYRWRLRPDPYTTVKPDNTQNSNTGKERTENLAKRVISSINTYNSNFVAPEDSADNPNYDPYYRIVYCNYTKVESDYVAMSNGEHIRQLNSICTDNDVLNVQKSISGAPFGNSIL